MASEDLVPTYLAEIYNRAVPDQNTDNTPLQGVTAPVDQVTMTDSFTTQTATLPAKYGVARYAAANYGNH